MNKEQNGRPTKKHILKTHILKTHTTWVIASTIWASLAPFFLTVLLLEWAGYRIVFTGNTADAFGLAYVIMAGFAIISFLLVLFPVSFRLKAVYFSVFLIALLIIAFVIGSQETDADRADFLLELLVMYFVPYSTGAVLGLIFNSLFKFLFRFIKKRSMDKRFTDKFSTEQDGPPFESTVQEGPLSKSSTIGKDIAVSAATFFIIVLVVGVGGYFLLPEKSKPVTEQTRTLLHPKTGERIEANNVMVTFIRGTTYDDVLRIAEEINGKVVVFGDPPSYVQTFAKIIFSGGKTVDSVLNTIKVLEEFPEVERAQPVKAL